MLLQLYKQAYSGLSRNSWYLCLVMLVNRSGTMVIPFMTIYCTQKLHFSIVQAGIIMMLFGFGSVVGGFIGGKITDKYGFYDVQAGALLSGGVLFMILGLQHTFLSIATLSFILSMCNDAFRPANSTAIAYYSSAENKTRSFSLNRLAVNLGWALGGAVGGFLASVNYHLLFWVDGSTNILAGIMLLILMPRSKIVNASKAAVAASKDVSASAYKDKIYLVFIFFQFLFAMCFFQLFTMQPVFYKEQWHLSEQFIGGLMALSGTMITLIEMVLVNNLEGRRHQLQFTALGVLIVGSSFIVLNILPAMAFTAILSMVIITIGEMMSMPFMSSFFIGRTTDQNRGQYAGLFTMSWSLAQIGAPLIGSRVIEKFNYQALWWLMGLICFIASAGFLLLYKVTSRKERALMEQVM
ncbi:MFS transporter [Mucilaginibacter sp. PPCGB 2223]|uniref:MFS transporter n=1 Tax=Mucilaginibacter sp. PPCGB 2223 TaxID=1886027 RepID=UPI0008258BD6|nr:MFS transporter [Mucilaginibacter sp. PPCGB 2223]OCX52844.1 MFS transporter [Mucilaginibacter sp. PPCGB 2223]